LTTTGGVEKAPAAHSQPLLAQPVTVVVLSLMTVSSHPPGYRSLSKKRSPNDASV